MPSKLFFPLKAGPVGFVFWIFGITVLGPGRPSSFACPGERSLRADPSSCLLTYFLFSALGRSGPPRYVSLVCTRLNFTVCHRWRRSRSKISLRGYHTNRNLPPRSKINVAASRLPGPLPGERGKRQRPQILPPAEMTSRHFRNKPCKLARPTHAHPDLVPLCYFAL
jgi:hypothetical protein